MGGKPRPVDVSRKLTLLAEELETVTVHHDANTLFAPPEKVGGINDATFRELYQIEHTMYKLIEGALPKEAAQRFREMRSMLDEVLDDMSYD